MPTYTYKREDGTTFDLQQKISADALTTCPSTGQAVKRVITGGGGVVYKGDGWYITDYKNKGNKSADSGTSKTNKSANNEGSEKLVDANKSSATTGESSSNDTNSNPSST